MSDPIDAFAPAVDMLAALRARRVSAVELLELHQMRIERHNPELNAIVEPDFERARREAEAADTRRARGEDAPLRGLPMTLKESINVRGLRTTVGMSVWKDFRAEHDAPVTTRVQGPLARSADDLELALDVAAGAEVGEDVAWQITIPPARRDRLADFRVAVLPPIGWVPVDVEVAAALESFASQLGRLGCQVKTVQPAGLGDYRQPYALYLTLLAAVTSSRLPAEQRRARLEVMRTRDDDGSAPFQRGIESGAPDYIAWFGQREQYRAAWRAFFRERDGLLAPAFIAPAYPHCDKPCPNTPASIGPYLEDRTRIRFTALAARELGGFVRPPRYEGD